LIRHNGLLIILIIGALVLLFPLAYLGETADGRAPQPECPRCARASANPPTMWAGAMIAKTHYGGVNECPARAASAGASLQRGHHDSGSAPW
jgi:hypothetical protein